jgi:chaperone required for assembly of F1-ATPase
MAKSIASKRIIKNITEAEVHVSELPPKMYSKVQRPYNRPLYCILIDEKILKTPLGKLIVHEDLRAMTHLEAEIDSLDELDVEPISLFNLLSTQIDFVDQGRQEFSEEILKEALWNDPVLRPLTGPEVRDQLKHLGAIKEFLNQHELEYPYLPQIPFENSTDFLSENLEFDKLISFVKSFLPNLNSQQLTVFVTTTHVYHSPILGLMLATKRVDAYQFANVLLKMQGVSSKIDRDINRKEERALLEIYKEQAQLMIQYLVQFSPRQTEEFNEPVEKSNAGVKNNNTFRYVLQTAIDLYSKTQKRNFSDVLAEMDDQLGYGRNSHTVQSWLNESIVPNSAEVEYFVKKITSGTNLDKKWARDFFDAAGYEAPEIFSDTKDSSSTYALSGDFRNATVNIKSLWVAYAHEEPADIFISYARSDANVVQNLYETLLGSKHHPWMDVNSIKGGENWLRAIYKAIDECQIFLAVLSNNSVSRRGVIQKELKKALDKWDGMLPDDIYIIPVRIDDCPIPDLLKHIQVLEWDNGKGESKLLEAIRVGLARRKDG